VKQALPIRGMDNEHLHAVVRASREDPAHACKMLGIELEQLENFIVQAMASEEPTYETSESLVALCEYMPDRAARVRTLNQLLLLPTHRSHQRVTHDIQDEGDPSSIAPIREILAKGFADFAYTFSDDVVIAKWFGHALWRIGTPEAIALIREQAGSANPGIAEEMTYRLERIAEATPELLLAADRAGQQDA